jgi:hypothetical protein
MWPPTGQSEVEPHRPTLNYAHPDWATRQRQRAIRRIVIAAVLLTIPPLLIARFGLNIESPACAIFILLYPFWLYGFLGGELVATVAGIVQFPLYAWAIIAGTRRGKPWRVVALLFAVHMSSIALLMWTGRPGG